MKLPPWLKKLTRTEERQRAAKALTPKRDGWYKWVAGKVRYICKPCGALEAVAVCDERVKAIEADIASKVIPVVSAGLTLEGLAELYIAWLKQRLETGIPRKLSRRTYDDIIETLDRFVEIVGPAKFAEMIGADDFSRFARSRFAGRAASTIRREMIYIEAFANWAAPGSRKAGHLSKPWKYGPDFVKPSEDQLSLSAADSDKSYTPAQLRHAFLTVKNSPMLRAAGWIALCGAMQPKDLALLPEANVDLKAGLVSFPRGKTGVGRMAWLTPAAVLAVKTFLKTRSLKCQPEAKGLLFRTKAGLPCYREKGGDEPSGRHDYFGKKWSRLTGLPLSGLRSTFATVADDYADQRAVDVVLGHKAGHAARKIRSKHYAKRFKPERVKQLVSCVVSLAFGRALRTQEQAALPASPSPAAATSSAAPAGVPATAANPIPAPETSPAPNLAIAHPSQSVRRTG